ncbi:MAG TPA: ABC transporter permease [Candidatus Acidoferrales bacterium]|nr:ABC transporter permease [Candidatus Acidoferrales bacterium]
MILRNVFHRPVRTAVCLLAVAVEVSVVVLVVGLTTGLITETGKRIEGVGADVMLQPPSASVWLGFSSAPMPIKLRQKLEQMHHVASVAPVLLQFNASGLEIVYGIEPESFREVSGGFVFHAGRDLEKPDDMIVDDVYATSHHLKAGQTYRLFEHDFQIVGVVEHGKGARIFVPIETLQDIAAAHDKASLFFIRCTRPEHTDAVMEDMRGIFPRYEIRPLKEYLSLMTATDLPGLHSFIDSMIALAVSIGFLVIFLCMYTTIMERTRQIGVLKSLGASDGYIAQAILGESATLCLMGSVCGIGLSFALRALALAKWPNLSILMSAGWMLRAVAIALVGGLLGAAYPTWLACRKDPVEALAFE